METLERRTLFTGLLGVSALLDVPAFAVDGGTVTYSSATQGFALTGLVDQSTDVGAVIPPATLKINLAIDSTGTLVPNSAGSLLLFQDNNGNGTPDAGETVYLAGSIVNPGGFGFDEVGETEYIFTPTGGTDLGELTDPVTGQTRDIGASLALETSPFGFDKGDFTINQVKGTIGSVPPPTTLNIKGSPAISTTPGGTVVLGSGKTLSDTATVIGGNNPTGTVSFSLYDNPNGPNGAAPPLFTDANEPLVNGVATSKTYLPTAVGTDYWVATYNGDANNYPITSPATAEPEVVSPAPTIVTQQQPATAVVGSSIADTATVSGGLNPTGSVTFALYNNATASNLPLFVDANEPLNSSGVATSKGYTATATGTDYWVATYNGDTNNQGVTSLPGAEPVNVTQAAPKILTTASPAVTLASGAALGDSAVVSGGYNETGMLVFTLTGPGGFSYTQSDTLHGNDTYTASTTLPATGAAAGTYTWSVSYAGDANNKLAVDQGGAAEQTVVSPATPAITTTPSATTTTGTGGFATIGYWHNKNGQATITNFNGSPSSTALGNYLASNFPNLFGLSNPYTGTSLAGLTNTQIAAVYKNLWTPGGQQKNTYVQAFAVALGLYSTGGQGTFSLGGNGAAFSGLGSSPTVFQILQAVSSNFSPSTGQFYGGNSTLTGDANNVLNGINTSGETSSGSTVTINKLNDSATLSGGYNPTGTVTFYLMAPGATATTPLSSAVYTDTVTVTGPGTYSTSDATGNLPGGYMPTATGTYQWVAKYSGDTANSPVTSPFGSEPWTVGQQSPTVFSTTPNVTSVTLGGSSVTLTDTADLEQGVSPTGSITFYLFAPGTAPVSDGNGGYTYNNAVFTSTVAVNGNGNNYTSAAYTLPATAATGTYQWDAVYSGDGNNVGDTFLNDPAERVVVSAPSTPVGAGAFATIGFWHNKNGQAVINSFNGSSSSKLLGNWLSTNFPSLFGVSNPYTGTSLAGLTNAQVAGVYSNLWNPSGVTKNTYVQAFAVALGMYADTGSLGYNSTGATFGFKAVTGGGGNETFNVGSNGAAFGVANNTKLTVLQILQVVNNNFSPSTGNFYGGDQTKTSAANNVLNGINTNGDISLVTDGSVSTGENQPLTSLLHPIETGLMVVAVDTASFQADPNAAAEEADIADAIVRMNAELGPVGVTVEEVQGDESVAANVHLHLAANSAIGGVDQGVLGVTQGGTEITLISGWNYYTGADPAGIAADQYDFETVAAHELGHALGLGHSTDTSSVMYPYLATGQVRRNLTSNDLAVIDSDAGTAPEPLMAAPRTATAGTTATPSPTAAAGSGKTGAPATVDTSTAVQVSTSVSAGNTASGSVSGGGSVATTTSTSAATASGATTSPGKPVAHKPAHHKPVAHKPAAQKPAHHKPAAQTPAAHKPAHPKPAAHAKPTAKIAAAIFSTTPIAVPVLV